MFYETRISQITPKGWIKDFLITEKNGIVGNLDSIGYPFNTECWSYKTLAAGGYEGWWPYEQVAYWIDSMIRLSFVLKDDGLAKRVIAQIDKSIENAKDGFIGAEELKETEKLNQWPHAVYFRAIIALWSATNDDRYIEAMHKHYLTDTCKYSCEREIVNIETIFKIFEITGDERLKDIAEKAYGKFNSLDNETDTSLKVMLSDKKAFCHGVTFNEQAKLGAIVYKYTGDINALRASENAYRKIDMYHMLSDGVHSSSEFTKSNDALQAHETCDISDYTWSMGYLLMATEKGEYADKIERACFNAALGAIGPNFKTIQYYSSPNQVLATRNSNHSGSHSNSPRFAFQPHHYPECCVGNVGRIIPNYVARMYLKSEEGVAVALYGDSVFKANEITLVQETNYPFDDTIKITVNCSKPIEYSIKFRMPAWCSNYSIMLNNKNVNCKINNGFTEIKEIFENNDVIILRFSMEFKICNSPDGGKYFEYGPMLLSLKIDELWERDLKENRQTKDFPAWNVYPRSDWNYAVSKDDDFIIDNVKVTTNVIDKQSWWNGCPIEFKIPARKINGWVTKKVEFEKPIEDAHEVMDDKMFECGATEIKGELELTPEFPTAEYIKNNLMAEENIVLVPYGCTNLRLTVFPIY